MIELASQTAAAAVAHRIANMSRWPAGAGDEGFLRDVTGDDDVVTRTDGDAAHRHGGTIRTLGEHLADPGLASGELRNRAHPVGRGERDIAIDADFDPRRAIELEVERHHHVQCRFITVAEIREDVRDQRPRRCGIGAPSCGPPKLNIPLVHAYRVEHNARWQRARASPELAATSHHPPRTCRA